jgi:ubiquinone/menaquinone biosynthesis C-methylase UbiE
MYSYSLSYYQKVFDILAPHYRIVDLLSLGMADVLRRKAIRTAAIRKKSVVIDMMCGMGSNAKHLTLEKTGITYVGLDASLVMILRARTQRRNSPEMTFLHTNILNQSGHPPKGGHVLCSYGLKCISPDDYTAFVNNLDLMIDAGGTFSFVEFQLPKKPLLRWMTKTYLRIVYNFLCYLFLTDTTPAKALLQNLEASLQPDLLIALLKAKGLEAALEKKLGGAVIFVYGKKV